AVAFRAAARRDAFDVDALDAGLAKARRQLGESRPRQPRIDAGARQRTRLFAQCRGLPQRLAVAAQVELHLCADRLQAFEVAQGVAVVDALAVGGHDDVADLDARVGCGRIRVHTGHDGAARVGQ